MPEGQSLKELMMSMEKKHLFLKKTKNKKKTKRDEELLVYLQLHTE